MPEREEQDTKECGDVAELLPVYLNRSLEAADARRVEAHLASCAACRREERDTRTAWALFEGHLPVELLLDYAMAQPMSSGRRKLVESHLAVCARCSEEVTMVRQEPASDQRAFGPTPLRRPQPAGPGRGRLWTLAVAAGLATVVASAGWIWTWRQLVDERTLSPGRTARANLSVVELLPATHPLQRGTEPTAAGNRVEVLEEAGELVLVLLSGGRSCESGCLLEIFEAGSDQPKRRVEGLMASPDGHVTLALPSDWLPPDRSVLAVRNPSGELVAEYLVER